MGWCQRPVGLTCGLSVTVTVRLWVGWLSEASWSNLWVVSHCHCEDVGDRRLVQTEGLSHANAARAAGASRPSPVLV